MRSAAAGKGSSREFPGGAVLKAAFLALVLASCATPAQAPQADLSSPPDLARLGAGADAYLSVEVPALLPLLRAYDPKLAANADAMALLGKTVHAEAALFPAGSGQRWRALSYGDYPRRRAALSFWLSPSWKRLSAPKPYWHSAQGLSVAFDLDGAALLSDASPWAGVSADPGSAGAAGAVPAAYGLLPAKAFLRGWLASPAKRLASALGGAGGGLPLPAVAELAFALEAGTDGYRLAAVAALPGEREARTLDALLRLARSFGAGAAVEDPLAALLMNGKTERDGKLLRFESQALEPESAAALLRRLLPSPLYFADR